MSYNNILSITQNGITTITINRPNKLNALNIETIQELHDAFKDANDDKNVKVILNQKPPSCFNFKHKIITNLKKRKNEHN